MKTSVTGAHKTALMPYVTGDLFSTRGANDTEIQREVVLACVSCAVVCCRVLSCAVVRFVMLVMRAGHAMRVIRCALRLCPGPSTDGMLYMSRLPAPDGSSPTAAAAPAAHANLHPKPRKKWASSLSDAAQDVADACVVLAPSLHSSWRRDERHTALVVVVTSPRACLRVLRAVVCRDGPSAAAAASGSGGGDGGEGGEGEEAVVSLLEVRPPPRLHTPRSHTHGCLVTPHAACASALL